VEDGDEKLGVQISESYVMAYNIIMRMSYMRAEGKTLSECEYIVYRECCEFVASYNKALRLLQDQENVRIEDQTESDQDE